MSNAAPYAFGDVVDGHRWTVLGWERIDAEPTEAHAVDDAATPEAASDVAPEVQADDSSMDGTGPTWSDTDEQAVSPAEQQAVAADEPDEPDEPDEYNEAVAADEPVAADEDAVDGVEVVVDLREPVVTAAVAASPRRTRTRDRSSRRPWSATHAVEDFGDEIAVAHVDERDPGAELAASAYAPAGRSWVLPAPGAGWYPGAAPGLDG